MTQIGLHRRISFSALIKVTLPQVGMKHPAVSVTEWRKRCASLNLYCRSNITLSAIICTVLSPTLRQNDGSYLNICTDVTFFSNNSKHFSTQTEHKDKIQGWCL